MRRRNNKITFENWCSYNLSDLSVFELPDDTTEIEYQTGLESIKKLGIREEDEVIIELKLSPEQLIASVINLKRENTFTPKSE
jgi:hypothetical protein